MKRVLLAIAMALLVAGGPIAAQETTPDATPRPPNFSSIQEELTDCSVLDRSGAPVLTDALGQVLCGTMPVPENWSIPDGRQIEIRFAVLVSTSPHPRPDPIVVLAGGPGMSVLSGIGEYATTFQELRRDRHILLFDQRGAASSPSAQCSSSNPDVLEATGADLSQYTSRASATDTVALVRALGFDQFDLYGISEGTGLALTVMRDHPHSGIRSVALDSTSSSLGACPSWNADATVPAEKAPVVSDIPTLILAGTGDGQTPFDWDMSMFVGLANVTFVQLPPSNHDASEEQICTSTIAARFFDAPNGLPELGCVEARASP